VVAKEKLLEDYQGERHIGRLSEESVENLEHIERENQGRENLEHIERENQGRENQGRENHKRESVEEQLERELGVAHEKKHIEERKL
jgi:hypothetical protein